MSMRKGIDHQGFSGNIRNRGKNMRAIERIREYRESHGTAYTLKRLGQTAAQQLLGTYDRRWRREKATEAELQRQR